MPWFKRISLLTFLAINHCQRPKIRGLLICNGAQRKSWRRYASVAVKLLKQSPWPRLPSSSVSLSSPLASLPQSQSTLVHPLSASPVPLSRWLSLTFPFALPLADCRLLRSLINLTVLLWGVSSILFPLHHPISSSSLPPPRLVWSGGILLQLLTWCPPGCFHRGTNVFLENGHKVVVHKCMDIATFQAMQTIGTTLCPLGSLPPRVFTEGLHNSLRDGSGGGCGRPWRGWDVCHCCCWQCGVGLCQLPHWLLCQHFFGFIVCRFQDSRKTNWASFGCWCFLRWFTSFPLAWPREIQCSFLVLGFSVSA